MSKRPLTHAELTAAAALSKAVAASGKSQEKIGGEVGVSQGQV